MAVGAREGRAAAQESRVLASNILNMAAQGVTASREKQEMSLELESARVAVAANASVAAGLEEQVGGPSTGRVGWCVSEVWCCWL